ncbi:laminin subunit beta-1-like [Puntigrus tetrazona]|uniref:laminin subunit beta-1-like n=1 Tax=Puntigrus tetrazona TaxID=1606681 RepID=UPI001C890F39|nr:laminin subunit beta-1-like [Puntigrus tetrazona]
MLASQRRSERKEATDVKDTSEMVKEALQQAERAQSSVTEALKQASADIKGTQDLLVSDLDSELKDKYSSVEQVITQKAEGVAEAKKRAEKLQQEAKTWLLQASDKLQLLKNPEKNYDVDQKLLEDKANELVHVDKAVKELLQEISHKVTVYST